MKVRVREGHPISWPAVRRHGQLAIGVAGTLGGGVLLSTNIVYLVMSGAATLPWVPLIANAALILGGALFLREHRRTQGDR